MFAIIWKREKLPFPPLPLDPGDFLLSQAVPSLVPSAFGGLTSVFGMGTGGSLQLSSPETFSLPFALRSFAFFAPASASLPHSRSLRPSGFAPLPHASRASASLPPHLQNCTGSRVDQQFKHSLILSLSDQALDRLVSPSSTRYRASTDDLSTSSSLRGLTCL